tara:strand:+ start:1197 stop:1931 length:735 start_codon:yes stop_codon:yes gene_type:complete
MISKKLIETDFTLDLVFNAFNEIESIEDDIKEILKKTIDIVNLKNIIIVEDGSTDGTSERLKELSKKYQIKLNQSKQRRGYSKALIDGINASESDFIFFSDLGGKFDWEDISKLTEYLPEHDFVLGIRVNRRDQIYRQLLTLFYSIYIRIFYGIKSKDPDSGFRIYKKSLIDNILSQTIHNKHLLNSEFTIKCIKQGAKYKEVGINYIKREGTSRGLPLKIIPSVIIFTIINSFKIKKQVKLYE